MKKVFTTNVIEEILNRQSVSGEFHQKTKIHDLIVDEGGIIKKVPEIWKDVSYKGYPRFPRIPLPGTALDKTITLERVLMNRKSSRDFNPEVSMSSQELSTLLRYSFGIRNYDKQDIGNRFYPSAGARYPHEVYPLIFRVNGLNQGVYHYYLRNHSLESLWTPADFIQKADINFNQKWIKNTSALLVISAIFQRNQIKYKERGYRHILVDTGHVCQNIYLVGEALGLKCCSIGGFIDDGLNDLIGLDGHFESVVIVVAVGK